MVSVLEEFSSHILFSFPSISKHIEGTQVCLRSNANVVVDSDSDDEDYVSNSVQEVDDKNEAFRASLPDVEVGDESKIDGGSLVGNLALEDDEVAVEDSTAFLDVDIVIHEPDTNVGEIDEGFWNLSEVGF